MGGTKPGARTAANLRRSTSVPLSYAGVMGVGIEVLIVDWPRVEAAVPGDREEMLIDAAFGEVYGDDLFEHGWSWPTQSGEDWYGRYALRNTLGSYKPHFWAGTAGTASVTSSSRRYVRCWTGSMTRCSGPVWRRPPASARGSRSSRAPGTRTCCCGVRPITCR